MIMKKLFLSLLICLPIFLVGQPRTDIYTLRPSPDSLDQIIAPRLTNGTYHWKKTPVVTWWANLSDSTRAYILSEAAASLSGGVANSITQWVDSYTIDTTGMYYTGTFGVNTTPTEAVITTKAAAQPARTSNFVAQQTFADNTNWTEGSGWLIGAGVAAATASSASLTYIPSITIVPGRAYEVIYTQSGWAAGTAVIFMGDASYSIPSVNQTNTAILRPTSATGGFRITGGAYTGNLDNITVHEITPATWQYGGQLSSSSTVYGGLSIPNSSSLSFGGAQFSTGTGNTGVGILALTSNSTATNNTALGRQALSFASTGSSNTAVGYQALTAIGTGASNTAVGYRSLGGIYTTSNNTAIGYDAGKLITAGTDNVTGANSTFLGYDARPAADAETNETVIGYTARGKGSNTATIGNSSVTVLWLGGEVGWFKGTGSPEGVVTAPIGSFYSDKAGGSGTTFWVKESGTGNTGWDSK